MKPDSPWRVADFRKLITAVTLGQLATNAAYVGMPVLAVVALDAGPGQVGALAALSTVAFLVIGLPAGAWVDRMRHRRVLIAADLARAAAFASVPLAWWLDLLSLPQLYAVVLLAGCATVFADVGAQSVLPRMVRGEALVSANAAVVSLIAAGQVAGRSVGGGLIQLLTAPVALACAAFGYLAAALRLTGLRRTTAPPSPAPGTRLRTQIAEGTRHVLGNPELRALALTGALSNFGAQFVNTMLPIVFVSELGLSAGALGLFWAAGGIGLLLGSRCAALVAARLGHGRALAVAGLCLGPAALVVPFVGHGPLLWLAGAGWMLAMFKIGMDNVLGVSLRQRMTPQPLLGRMNATFRFLLTGALAVGAAAAGVLGSLTTVHVTVWAGAAVIALAFLPVYCSPVRRRRELPAQAAEGRAPAEAVVGGSRSA